ncbi:hypothetical protein DRE_02213 [Drechslerella stenobrocha 248]|uniref:Glutamine amidotransferase domain-containing protein n=1 Tax=Drechslerella stenobrocha 248 TaxID=1043628 RepID=W7HY58_9PEZI|nr:hypothetical protein DRE_02213 [Drechslerella stenobrocha 248]
MQPPLRIAVLETDTPSPAFQSKFGTYGDAVIRLLRAAATVLDPPLDPNDIIFTKWDVENHQDYYPEASDIDAILICGNQDLLPVNATDSTQWIIKLTDFTRKILLEQDRIRVIGANFGHLIVGRALGCVIDRTSWETSISTISLNDMGKKLYGADYLSMVQLHRDSLVTLPTHPFPQLPEATLDIVGETDLCAVQGLYTSRKVISLQGSPELSGDMITMLAYERVRQGHYTQEYAQDAVQRAALRNNGVAIGAAFLRFLLEP